MTKPAKLRAIALTPLLMVCAACGHDRVRLVLPPAELATCADEPLAPDLPARDGTEAVQRARDTLTFDYVLGMRSAWGDCRSKVDGLKAWRETAGK